jgi:enterochelin esterase-like enzyme
VETAVFPSLTAGEMNARIYLPPCYGLDGKSYPTLYMLGGNIHTEAFWDDLGLDETAEELIVNQQIPPLIVVMPAGGTIANNTSGGPGSYETVILHDLIPFVEKTYCAAPASEFRAIGGVSRGGYWSLEIAFRHPTQFVSVGGHSAALLDTYAGPDLNPQYTGLTQNLGDLRIYMDIGQNDYVIHNIRVLHEEMEEQNIPHTWVLNEGSHDDAYWAAHLADYLNWYAVPWQLERDYYSACEVQK